MAPVAAAAYVLVASLAVFGVLLGALAGAATFAVRASFLWGALLAVGGCLLATVVLGSYRLTAALLLAMPQLIMTFVTAWLTGRALEARAGWRHAWATLVALICSLAVGAVYLSLLGRALGFPTR